MKTFFAVVGLVAIAHVKADGEGSGSAEVDCWVGSDTADSYSCPSWSHDDMVSYVEYEMDATSNGDACLLLNETDCEADDTCYWQYGTDCAGFDYESLCPNSNYIDASAYALAGSICNDLESCEGGCVSAGAAGMVTAAPWMAALSVAAAVLFM
eukprot:Rmarinus@m.4833